MISFTMPSAKYSCSRIAAHVVEGQDGDRWLMRELQQRPRVRSPLKLLSADPHWPCDVLELLLTCILEGNINLALRVFLHAARNANATRFCQRLQACRHVH